MKICAQANGTTSHLLGTILLAALLALVGCAGEDTETSPPAEADQQATEQLPAAGDEVVEVQEADTPTETILMTAEDGFNAPCRSTINMPPAPESWSLATNASRLNWAAPTRLCIAIGCLP